MTTLTNILCMAENKLLTVRNLCEKLLENEDVKALHKAIEEYFDVTRIPYDPPHRQEGAAEVRAFDKVRDAKLAEHMLPPNYRLAKEEDLDALSGMTMVWMGDNFWRPAYMVDGTKVVEPARSAYLYAVPK